MKPPIKDRGYVSHRPWGSLSNRERGTIVASSLRAFIAPIIVFVGLCLSTAPLFTPWPAWPNLGLALVFLYALYRPNQLPVWAAMPLGIVADVVFAMPLGVNAVLLPLFMLAIIWMDQRTARVHWLADWLVSVPFILGYQLILWRLCLLVGEVDAPALPFITQGLATLAAFPLVASIFVRTQRRFVDKVKE
ncbi:rod shape-determining protein MreD [Pacificimonas sp. ICDLI1SI03]|jgi:rod shape-determining protein MreD|tara:strand:+ start:116325 stop:116897 length:573 start_codon:yes stop_codon:yes gene_type:complete